MFIDPNDALISQLKRIADAASKGAPSPWLDWLRTVASFVAGLVTVFFGQWIQGRASDGREQKKIRRVVYLELSKNFIELNSIVSPYWAKSGKSILKKMRWGVLNSFITFEGEHLMVGNPAVFYQLEEGEILKWIYHWFHRLDVPKIDGSSKFGLAELRGPLSFFSDCFRKYPAFCRYLKKMVPDASFVLIQNATTQYEHIFSVEELVDSGLMEIIENGSQHASDPT